jgi:hypothetical protein
VDSSTIDVQQQDDARDYEHAGYHRQRSPVLSEIGDEAEDDKIGRPGDQSRQPEAVLLWDMLENVDIENSE